MTIRHSLTGKNEKERTQLKAKEVVKCPNGEFKKDGYTIEIQSVSEIAGGVEVFIRAWKGKKQIGFVDGTVEVERVRIFNPPILVDDPDGDIIQEWDDESGHHARTLKEDPTEALKQVLTHVVKSVGKEGSDIVKGKIGRTTSTFYPHSSDGDIYATGAGFATVRAAATGTVSNTNATELYGFYEGGASDELHRGFFHFDTSAIPDADTISAATFALVQTSSFVGTPEGGLVQSSAASDTSLATTDYNDLGSTEGATRLTITSGATNTWTLNSTGLTWISKTGYTKLGLRLGRDIDNSDPGTTPHYFRMYASEQTGTTNDPVLVVTHASSAVTPTSFPLLGIG